MEEEQITLQELQRPDAVIPQRNPLELVSPSDELDPIINNTVVEDTVRSTDGALLDGTISQRVQRLEDKKNRYNLLNKQYVGAEDNLIKETQGRGITQLGRRAELVSRQRSLDSKRQAVLADVEELRGNIETAQALRDSALENTSASLYKQELIKSLEEEGVDEALINQIRKQTDYQIIRLGNDKIGTQETTSALEKAIASANGKFGEDKLKEIADIFDMSNDTNGVYSQLGAAMESLNQGGVVPPAVSGFQASYEQPIEEINSAEELENSL